MSAVLLFLSQDQRRRVADFDARTDGAGGGDVSLRKWRHYSAMYREELKVGGDENPWTTRDNVELTGINPNLQRVIELLNCFCIDAQNRAAKDRASPERYIMDMKIDVSQSIHRGSTKGRLPCLHQHSMIYLYQKDVLLPGRYHGHISGYPKDVHWQRLLPSAEEDAAGANKWARYRNKKGIGKTKNVNGVIKSLVGEGYSLPSATAVHMAVFLNSFGPWWR